MIVEHRTYTLQPGKASEYLSIFEKEGYEVQTKYLGKPIGYYYTELGMLNQVIHMWRFESFEDRQTRRAALFKDPTWNACVAKMRAVVITQESKILLAAPFFHDHD